MMVSRVEMNGTALEALQKSHLEALSRATIFLHTEIMTALNVPNTGRRVKRKRGRGSYTIYPNPSKPGEAPRKRTGWLQRNVVYFIDRGNLSSRVGLTANARYGIALELGTRKMAARPWLLATAQRLAPRIADMMREVVSRG